jgi:hypothetical protein
MEPVDPSTVTRWRGVAKEAEATEAAETGDVM